MHFVPRNELTEMGTQLVIWICGNMMKFVGIAGKDIITSKGTGGLFGKAVGMAN